MRGGDTSAEKLVDPASRLTMKDTLDTTFIAAETTHAAVLFADMRGYVALAERLPPARVAYLLHGFFTILARITIEFGGQVFHMAGDGMMAGFAVRDPGDRALALRLPPAARCFRALRR